MNTIISFGLLTITSFFTLINPIGAMPVFLSLTMGWDKQERKKVAKKAVLVSLIILLIFAVTGRLLFTFFNITVDSFKIVGGVIFFHMGFNMLNAKYKAESEGTKKSDFNIAITPLAIPMITGPGAITNAIVLMEDAHTLEMKAVVIIGIIIVLIMTYFLLTNSIRILKVIGETGNNVMMRLMGLIVMVIAVEFFLAGIKPFLISIF